MESINPYMIPYRRLLQNVATKICIGLKIFPRVLKSHMGLFSSMIDPRLAKISRLRRRLGKFPEPDRHRQPCEPDPGRLRRIFLLHRCDRRISDEASGDSTTHHHASRNFHRPSWNAHRPARIGAPLRRLLRDVKPLGRRAVHAQRLAA